MDELSVNQSFVKKAFSYYEDLDRVDTCKVKRLTTLTQNGVLNECEYEDFYEEIEHIIRQENLQKNQVRGNRLIHGTAATVALNDQSFHRSQGQAAVNHHQKLFSLISSQNLGGYNKVWRNDAEGGYLSYTKMIYERN